MKDRRVGAGVKLAPAGVRINLTESEYGVGVEQKILQSFFYRKVFFCHVAGLYV
jgi:hypothetical protein